MYINDVRVIFICFLYFIHFFCFYAQLKKKILKFVSLYRTSIFVVTLASLFAEHRYRAIFEFKRGKKEKKYDLTL